MTVEGLSRSNLDVPQSEKRLPRYFTRIFPEDLNTLTQPREDFLAIDELATSMADTIPINEIWAGFFDNPDACQKYLNDLNKRWKGSHCLSELKTSTLESGEKGILIVIAGERRTKAYLQLKTTGCLICQEKNGNSPCFDTHFPDNQGKIDIKFIRNPDYNRQAVPLQEDENFHMSLPVGRLAFSIFNRFSSWKELYPNGTVAEFARSVIHKNPETVKKALKFAEGVPEIIQRWVNTGKFKYGHALELVRMREVGYDDIALIRAAEPALDSRNKMSLGPFKKRIDGFVRAVTEKQNMFDVFKEEETERAKKERFFSDSTEKTILDLEAAAQRLGILDDLLEFGLIPTERSPLVKRNGVKALDKLARQMIGVPTQLNGALHKATAQNVTRIGTDVAFSAEKLILLLPDQD